MRRGPVAILLIGLLALVVVQLLGPPGPRTSGRWRSVALDAERARWLDTAWGVVVGGQASDGGPLLAHVDHDEVTRLDVGDAGGVWSQNTASELAVVVDDDTTGAPRGWFVYDLPYPDSNVRSDGPVVEAFTVTDPSGRRPDRLWLTTEDEGAAAVGGFLDDAGNLGLAPQDWAAGTFADGPPGLYVAADADATDLWVGGTEGQYVVIGPVSPRPGATGTGVQVWSAWTMDDQRWQRHEPDGFPDQVTDMRGWVLDLYVAGPAGERPRVVGATGGSLPVPDVRLDPSDPTVLLAEVPTRPDERPSVVLQTPDGAVLYLAAGDGWTEVPLPPGRARRAVIDRREDGTTTAYALVDGTLWWQDLDA